MHLTTFGYIISASKVFADEEIYKAAVWKVALFTKVL